ncbi:hypothetical protein [Croceicoccus gelatinilyticus]|uniref:hypothetical protein n=1 Tax=Croceicoccus gelatinilyticus TaxID=2835536 RepID=UPI001BCD9693|nr:hypothetical protein [Croceicoccus gelatinilyticus]MBS7669148.1 hypothetical protein [Croceicoccus gelatinilyticus]
MTNRARLHSLLWTGAVALALALALALTLQVKAVNSQIAETEKSILATKQRIAVLETEFQTRARQQQLVRWNEVEFGYVAPKASQFLDGQAQLAMLGKPVDIIEAAPIRMADAAEVMAESEEAAPVRMASAEVAGPVKLKGDPDKAKADLPVRLAAAEAPKMMRQLVARDTGKAKPAALKPTAAKEEKAERAASFAERFDIDSVIGEQR